VFILLIALGFCSVIADYVYTDSLYDSRAEERVRQAAERLTAAEEKIARQNNPPIFNEQLTMNGEPLETDGG